MVGDWGYGLRLLAKKIDAGSSSHRAVHRFLPCLCPKGTLCEFQSKYITLKKMYQGTLWVRFWPHSWSFPKTAFLRVRMVTVLPKGYIKCSVSCKGWMDLNKELISYIYKVPFNQRAQNAIINTISLILTKHL